MGLFVDDSVLLLKKMKVDILSFTGPCIVIYSYNKIQQDALFLKFILM